jgi:hypothetical protein
MVEGLSGFSSGASGSFSNQCGLEKSDNVPIISYMFVSYHIMVRQNHGFPKDEVWRMPPIHQKVPIQSMAFNFVKAQTCWREERCVHRDAIA